MMKLKNLIIDTYSAAEAALKNWEHDENSLRFWRGSSNLVYYFKENGKIYFLRLSHQEENTIAKISAELEFLLYLRDNDYSCNYPIKSSKGNYIETIHTPLGIYYAVVFNQVMGEELEIDEMSKEQFKDWGKALASLHLLSHKFKPVNYKARNWEGVMDHIKDILIELPDEIVALKEHEEISNWLNTLAITDDNFGLIHYDFEIDNILWEKDTNSYNVIDFDDAMYHWYMMDIVRALEDLSELDEEYSKIGFNAFMDGYRSLKEINPWELDEIPSFIRFSKLYSFARLMRTLKDSDFDEDPDWLKVVRPKLVNKCNRLRESFKVSNR